MILPLLCHLPPPKKKKKKKEEEKKEERKKERKEESNEKMDEMAGKTTKDRKNRTETEWKKKGKLNR
jgi:hypothetical protein